MSTDKFSEKLKALRKETKSSIYEMANAVGVSTATLYSYEAGRSIPSIKVISKIATFYDVPVESLISAGAKEIKNKSFMTVNARLTSKQYSMLRTIAGTKDKTPREYATDLIISAIEKGGNIQ